MTTRRSFFKKTCIGLIAASMPKLFGSTSYAQQPAVAGNPQDTFRLGIAGYSFYKFKLDQTLEMLKKVDVHYLCIKDFHLPMKSTDEEIVAFHEQCKASGVTGYAVGPIYMGSEQAVDEAFAYAKRAGVKLIVGVPHKEVNKKKTESPELLKYIEGKVKEYDFKYAIHNHGPDGLPYANAECIMSYIKNLDSRIGMCLDIGHNLRTGADPIADMEKYAHRVYDIHIKNITSPDKKGCGIELPRGIIDLTSFVRMLRKVKYSGMCSLEYEKDMDNPLAGIAESIGYFRGIIDATK
ncbi:MAG: sugar phosphate isomerase/epimerase [Kiritimatiellae bacterium]|nr:sugar phosphate isomerase/epimerase [Kiritimatiellia bacterium]MDD5521970.1 sugar phosphate isomerase/epimerase [Kiritimatiellia bacterium]